MTDQSESVEGQTTPDEERAIRSLERLARKWPDTLLLASMGGSLVVMHTDDEAFHSGEGPERSKHILASIQGIPNDGGDW